MQRLGAKLASLPRLRAIATLSPFPPDARARLAAAGFEERAPAPTSQEPGGGVGVGGVSVAGSVGGGGAGGGGAGGGGDDGTGHQESAYELSCSWGAARVHLYVRQPPGPVPIG